MKPFKKVETFLGYGGEGQPLGPVINQDRVGEEMPPTFREVMEYGLYLCHTYADQNHPLDDLIK